MRHQPFTVGIPWFIRKKVCSLNLVSNDVVTLFKLQHLKIFSSGGPNIYDFKQNFDIPTNDENGLSTGVVGFEPTHEGVKVPCLTAWLYPNNVKRRVRGIEPPNVRATIWCVNHFTTPAIILLTRAVGIEPTLKVLETLVLPLNYARKMEGEGFEPPNPKERIYSPPRLASSLPFQNI